MTIYRCRVEAGKLLFMGASPYQYRHRGGGPVMQLPCPPHHSLQTIGLAFWAVYDHRPKYKLVAIAGDEVYFGRTPMIRLTARGTLFPLFCKEAQPQTKPSTRPRMPARR